MSRSGTDWNVTDGRVVTSEAPESYGSDSDRAGAPGVPPPRTAVRRPGSRLIPVLMLLAAYAFTFWAWQTIRDSAAILPTGYEYMVILTGVPFLLAAHGFALVRWGQLRSLDPVQGTVRDVTTDVALSVWEIFFCWLGISASLMFLYYAAPIAELKDWNPRLFLVLVVFFGATYQKALVFVFALLPFVATLTALSLWVYGVPFLVPEAADVDTVFTAVLLAADLAVLAWAIRLARRNGGFRVCEFQMPLGAGFTGGHLAGVLRTRQKSTPEAGYQLQLSCLQQYKQGDKKRRQGQVLWHAQKTVRGDLPGARHTDASVPVVFALPSDAPATSTSDEDNRVSWTLRATAALPESDFSCVFEVPVQHTEDPALLQLPVHLAHAQGGEPPDPRPASRPSPSGGTVFGFRTTWNRATEFVTIAYFLFWFQLIWLATSHEIGWEIWAMFGAGVWFLGWVMIPWTSRTEVTVNAGLIKVINRRLFLKTNTAILVSDLHDIVGKPGSLRTGLMEGLDFYHLEMRYGNGKTVTAGRHLRDRWQARMIAQTMKEFIAGAP